MNFLVKVHMMDGVSVMRKTCKHWVRSSWMAETFACFLFLQLKNFPSVAHYLARSPTLGSQLTAATAAPKVLDRATVTSVTDSSTKQKTPRTGTSMMRMVSDVSDVSDRVRHRRTHMTRHTALSRGPHVSKSPWQRQEKCNAQKSLYNFKPQQSENCDVCSWNMSWGLPGLPARTRYRSPKNGSSWAFRSTKVSFVGFGLRLLMTSLPLFRLWWRLGKLPRWSLTLWSSYPWSSYRRQCISMKKWAYKVKVLNQNQNQNCIIFHMHKSPQCLQVIPKKIGMIVCYSYRCYSL